uniref:ANP1c n=1 Tax=Pseudomonas protegens TaxID=380021 RepID=A0A221Y5D8_9PSED|nr:ANP1c [Pseudomonas protegens]
MKAPRFVFFLIAFFGLVNGGVAVAAPENCPSGSYSGVHLRYVGYRESDGYITFAVKEDNGQLKSSKEYWLSNYKMDNSWAKATYSGALTALMAGSSLWINCSGKALDQLYIYAY